MDSGPPDFVIPGILLEGTMEWIAIFFSNAWKWKMKVNLLSPVQLFETLWTAVYQAPLSMGFSRQEYWNGLPLPSLIQAWCTPFPVWSQTVVPSLVLTLASWPEYIFLRRQVKWTSIPILWRIFHNLHWSLCATAHGTKKTPLRHHWVTELKYI